MKFWMGVAFAEPDELFDLARAADDSGWHGITVSDHIAYLKELRSPYPYTEDGKPGWQPETSWPDPWVTIGALAAATRNLHFTTNVYVGPLRDTVTVAKAIATAAVDRKSTRLNSSHANISYAVFCLKKKKKIKKKDMTKIVKSNERSRTRLKIERITYVFV